MPHSAIVQGNYKVMHFYESPDIPMLFDLSTDRCEVDNIATRHPEIQDRLHKQLMTYLQDVGARIPKPNPDFDQEAYSQAKEHGERLRWGAFSGTRMLGEDER